MTHGRAAGNPDLRNNNAVFPNGDVMANLHQIIDHGAAPNHRIRAGSPIDAGVGANIHMVL